MQSNTTKSLYRGVQAVWYSLYLIEGLLLMRVLFKLFNANPAATFTNLIYNLSDALTWPFSAVFSDSIVSSSTFEWTTLLAMLVYWLIAIALIKLFAMSKSVSTLEADEKLSQENN